MRIYRHLPQDRAQSMALAIGNFDGLHLGHQTLLSRLVEEAKRHNITPAVMTFEPHPREFFMPAQAPARLSSLREKLEYFEEVGVAEVFISRFNQAFAAINAQDFMQKILKKSLKAQTILVGQDFKFGAKRQGTVQALQAAGFNLIDFPPVTVAEQRVSSTLVRNALADGKLQQAAAYLGRPYSISGKVVHGAKRGREIRFSHSQRPYAA